MTDRTLKIILEDLKRESDFKELERLAAKYGLIIEDIIPCDDYLNS